MVTLDALPSGFVESREGLHALACFVVAPARKARTGRIGLRSTGDGFGTPPFDDGSRILVRGDQLVREPGGQVPIQTLRHAAEFVGIELSDDPGVGRDLPPFPPDADLPVDAAASSALGTWYSFGQSALDRLATAATTSEAQLWPEHFDLAVTVDLDDGGTVNVGFSPGDAFSAIPYVYVGPHDTSGLADPFWNAPFGAYLSYEELRRGRDPTEAVDRFLARGLALVRDQR